MSRAQSAKRVVSLDEAFKPLRGYNYKRVDGETASLRKRIT